MKESSGMLFRLRAFFLRARMESELDEEMRYHLEREAEKHRASGRDPEDAEHEARLRFGRLSHHKDAARAAWGVRLFDEVVADARYALRQLLAHKTFSAVAILTLSLGVGGTVALFGAVHGLLLRPLPFGDAAQLRVFWDEYSWSAAEFDFARQSTNAYQGLATFTVDAQTFHNADRTSMVVTGLVSGDAFDVLEVHPLLGRALTREEERLGTPPVVILSHHLWQGELLGDPEVIGRQLELDGKMATVIGVMPEGFFFPTPEVDIWRPLVIDEADEDYRGNHWLVLFGRVRDGFSDEQVQADLDRFAVLLGENFEYPEAWDKTRGYFIEPFRQYLLGDVRPALLLLLGAVALLLLMASANVAALLVARLSDRETELGIRKAMGAGRFRLSRQLLTESLVLGVLASGFGLGLALLGYRAIVDRLPLPTGFERTLSLGWPLAAATLALVPTITLLVALAPLRRLWKRSGHRGLSSRRGLGPTSGHLQHGLVIGEIVIAVVLVTCAVLLARSVVELYRIDPGLDPVNVAAMDLFLDDGEPSAGAPDPELELIDQRRQFYTSLVEAAEASPGIEFASITNRLPLRDRGVQGTLLPEGRPDLDGARRPNCKWRYVSPNYFKALGIDLVEGRAFDDHDRMDATQVGIIGAEFAEQLWPGQSAVGKRVKMTFQYDDWIEIVGVTEGVRHDGVQESASAVLYRPLAQVYPWQAGILVMRSTIDPKAALGLARGITNQLDPRVAIARPTTMEEVLRDELAEPLRLRFFLGLFSALALVIGAVGVYGVISYTVSRRTAEYGLRMALGAERRDLLGSVMAGGVKLVALGVLAGLIAALASSALLSSFLYGVDVRDPWSYLAAGALLVVVGMLASTIPALRASRVDPARTLQGQD